MTYTIVERCPWCSSTDIIGTGSGPYGMDYECRTCGTTFRLSILERKNENMVGGKNHGSR